MINAMVLMERFVEEYGKNAALWVVKELFKSRAKKIN